MDYIIGLIDNNVKEIFYLNVNSAYVHPAQ